MAYAINNLYVSQRGSSQLSKSFVGYSKQQLAKHPHNSHNFECLISFECISAPIVVQHMAFFFLKVEIFPKFPCDCHLYCGGVIFSLEGVINFV